MVKIVKRNDENDSSRTNRNLIEGKEEHERSLDMSRWREMNHHEERKSAIGRELTDRIDLE